MLVLHQEGEEKICRYEFCIALTRRYGVYCEAIICTRYSLSIRVQSCKDRTALQVR